MLGRLLLPLLIALAGCASASPDAGGIPPPTPLRVALEDFSRYFAVRVEAAGDEILQRDLSPSINRASVLWKMRAIPGCREFLALADDEAALLGMWMDTVRMGQFLEGVDGKTVFGDGQPIAVATAKAIEVQIVALAKQSLTAETFAAAEKNLGDYVSSHPIGPNFDSHPVLGSRWGSLVSSSLGKPVSVVTSPLSFVNPTSGLSDTAAALHRVATTVDQLKSEVDYAPANLRWQTDLMMLELEENKTVVEALAALDQMGKDTASLSATAAALPTSVGGEVSKLLDEIDAKQANLQATLEKASSVMGETHATVTEVDKTLGQVQTVVASADTTSQSLSRLSESLTVTLETFTKLMEVLNAPSTEPPTEPPAPPFDINDFGRTADKLTETMKALGDVLVQVQDLTKPEQTRAIVDTADTAVQSTIDRLFLAAGLFVLFVAAVALGYRLLSRRIAPRPAA